MFQLKASFIESFVMFACTFPCLTSFKIGKKFFPPITPAQIWFECGFWTDCVKFGVPEIKVETFLSFGKKNTQSLDKNTCSRMSVLTSRVFFVSSKKRFQCKSQTFSCEKIHSAATHVLFIILDLYFNIKKQIERSEMDEKYTRSKISSDHSFENLIYFLIACSYWRQKKKEKCFIAFLSSVMKFFV